MAVRPWGPSAPRLLSCGAAKTISASPSPRTAPPTARNVRRRAPRVVPPVQACVVGRPIDPDPVGLVDPASVPTGWARGKSARDLDPAVLFPSYDADLLGYLREVLVLTQNQSDVVLLAMGHADDVERDADVDSLLLSRKEGVPGAVGKFHGLVPVAKRPAVDVDALPADRPELPFPEAMPELVVGGVRNPGVELSLDELPAARGAQPAGARMNVVVGVGVAERLPGAVEEVLPVNEDGRALDRRLRRAPGALRRKK